MSSRQKDIPPPTPRLGLNGSFLMQINIHLNNLISTASSLFTQQINNRHLMITE